MLVACWSAKGGVGTTIVATSLGILLARGAPLGALLVDLAGDAGPLLGHADDGQGVSDWLMAPPDVGAEALRGLEVEIECGVRLVPSGRRRSVLSEAGSQSRIEELAVILASDARPVVVDIGCGPDAIRAAGPSLRAATSSLLVVRPCYLGLRRALECGVRPTGVVLIDEPGRALRAADVEAVLGVRVCAHLDLDPAVARAADGGLLAHRLPRSLERGLRHAA